MNEAVGIRIRKGFEKDFIHDGEDGGVGPDAEGECEDGGDGETGGAEEYASGVAQILNQCPHTLHPSVY